MAEKKRLKYEKPELLDFGSIENTMGLENCTPGSTAGISCGTGGSATSTCLSTGAIAGTCISTGGNTESAYSGVGFFDFDLSKPPKPPSG